MQEDDLAGLDQALTSSVFGRAHEHHPQLASTNDRALAWAQEGAPHGALVTADRQLEGRGRRGRTWQSEDGGDLYFSVVVRPDAYPRGAGTGAPSWGAYSLAVGVGLREGLSPWLPDVELKWPNDLLWRGRKLGGILCEGRWQAGALRMIVVGVGINVGRRRFTPGLEDRATSVALALEVADTQTAVRESLRRRSLLASLLTGLEDVSRDFSTDGFAAIRGRYEPHCRLLGREIVAENGAKAPVLRGVAVGLDLDGALLVEPAGGGAQRRVEAADVWLATEHGSTTTAATQTER